MAHSAGIHISFLGGAPVAEYSNATHTQMVTVGTLEWSEEIFDAAALDRRIAPQIVPTGTPVGTVSCPLLTDSRIANAVLIAPACHDTGSAIAGIPAEGDDWAFISSGTWSLIGTLLPQACTSEAAMNFNFSNEGGLGGQSRFLKNVNGMWLLQECQRHWEKSGKAWESSELVNACEGLPIPHQLLDVDDPSLLLQGNMPERINTVLKNHGYPTFSAENVDAPSLANLIFHSLAERYAKNIAANPFGHREIAEARVYRRRRKQESFLERIDRRENAIGSTSRSRGEFHYWKSRRAICRTRRTSIK